MLMLMQQQTMSNIHGMVKVSASWTDMASVLVLDPAAVILLDMALAAMYDPAFAFHSVGQHYNSHASMLR